MSRKPSLLRDGGSFAQTIRDSGEEGGYPLQQAFGTGSRSIWIMLLLLVSVGVASRAVRAEDLELRIIDARAADIFSVLPDEANFPEGITANPKTRELFVGTVELGGGDNFVLRLDRRGRVVAQLAVGPLPLLGLAFNPRDEHVYIAAPGATVGQSSRIVRIPADFTSSTMLEDVAQVPLLPPVPIRVEPTGDLILFGQTPPVPNGLVFRPSDGALLFSDAAQGAILQIADPSQASNVCPADSSCVSTLIQNNLLRGVGFPNAGANGIALSEDESALFICNTGDDRLLRLDLAAGMLFSLLRADINGCDGMVLGPGGSLIITANQADQVVIVDSETGAVLAELGEFFGRLPSGTPLGLATPASPVLLGDSIFVTNTDRRPVADGVPGPATISRIRLPRNLRRP